LDLGGKRRLEDIEGIANDDFSEADYEYCQENPESRMCGRHLQISNSTMENGKGKGGRGLQTSNSTMENGKGKGGRGLEDRDGIIESEEEDVDCEESPEECRRQLAANDLSPIYNLFKLLDLREEGWINEIDLHLEIPTKGDEITQFF